MVRLYEYCDCICSYCSFCTCSATYVHHDVPYWYSSSPCFKIRCDILQKKNFANKDKLNKLVVNNYVNHFLYFYHHQCRYIFIYSGYLIYTRKVFTTHQAKLFFMFVIILMIIVCSNIISIENTI